MPGKKSYLLLAGAAMSLTLTGALLFPEPLEPWWGWLVRALVAAFLVGAVYGLDDWRDALEPGSAWVHGVPLAFLLAIALALSLSFLPLGSFWAALCIAVLGFLYSKPVYFWRREGRRLKSLFGVKNLIVAAGWALLLPLGRGGWEGGAMGPAFAFVFLQVFAGSAIRDIADEESDRALGIETLPVKLGLQPTLYALHALNLFSALFLCLGRPLLLPWLAAVAWRSLNLLLVQRYGKKKLLLQHMNLLTCVWILLACWIALRVS